MFGLQMYPCKVPYITIENVPSLPLVTKRLKDKHMLGSVHLSRTCTLPTHGPKGPTDKAFFILECSESWCTNDGFRTSLWKMYPPQRAHIYRDSYILGELSIGAQMLGSAQTSQLFFSLPKLYAFSPHAGICTCSNVQLLKFIFLDVLAYLSRS